MRSQTFFFYFISKALDISVIFKIYSVLNITLVFLHTNETHILIIMYSISLTKENANKVQ